MEIYGVLENGDVEPKFEIGNSFRGVSLVWSVLADKYLGGGPEWWLHEGLPARWRRVWALQNSPAPTEVDWFMLMSTFDNCIIPREHFEHAIRCFEAFHAECDASHYGRCAEAIRKLRDEGCLGYCVNATSVNQNPWRVLVKTGDDGEPEYRPYNINVDQKHWFLNPEERAKRLAQNAESPSV